MNKSIKAVLIKHVSFTDFDGNPRTLSPGDVVDITRVRGALANLDLLGRRSAEIDGSFFGSVGEDSFDLESDEFKTVD